MVSLLRAHEVKALLTAVDRLYEAVSTEGFPAHLFGVLKELLPGTVPSLDFMEVATGRVESHVAPWVSPAHSPGEVEAVIREFGWQNPVVDYLSEAHPRAVIQPTDLISQRQFRRTDLYQLAFRPSRMEYQIAAGLAFEGRHGGLMLQRDKGRNFTAREVELVRRLQPHVERALHLARMARPEAGPFPGPMAGPPRPGGRPRPACVPGLTPREREILGWLREGKRNLEIALILGISPRTVGKHVEHLFAKLGVETRVAAALQAPLREER